MPLLKFYLHALILSQQEATYELGKKPCMLYIVNDRIMKAVPDAYTWKALRL